MEKVWFVKLEDWARPFMAFAKKEDAEEFSQTYEASKPSAEKCAEIYEGWLVLDD